MKLLKWIVNKGSVIASCLNESSKDHIDDVIPKMVRREYKSIKATERT